MNSEPNIQRSSGEALRTRILDAARDLFLRFGYPKTSMQEIAGACEMSAANLYRYYDGKLAIGLAVAAREQAGTLATCDLAVQAAGFKTTERLTALFHGIIDATRRKMKKAPQLFELDMLVTRENPAVRQRFLSEIENRVLAILTAENPASPDDIKSRGKMILMASAPFLLPWMLLNEPFGDPRSMVEPLIRSLVAGTGESAAGGVRSDSLRPFAASLRRRTRAI